MKQITAQATLKQVNERGFKWVYQWWSDGTVTRAELLHNNMISDSEPVNPPIAWNAEEFEELTTYET